ncbi:helix-turn-helix transcriptional regulator [Mycolicibacterium fluoranthenivorans]|nr:helix-turn-helix domain-containing protein [Mycolicibacterium fluoranthenivorans]
MSQAPITDHAQPRLLGLTEVKERLGVGRSAVFNLVLSGELRSFKIGNRRLVAEAALVEYINRRDAEAAQA